MADSTGTSEGDRGDRAGGEPRESNDASADANTGGGMQAVINHIQSDKVEGAMWISRIVTLIFTISFVLPLFGWSQAVSGQRVLMAGAITSALRLHQRMPRVQMSREFIAQLFNEDSAHYLLYSVLMLFSAQPTSILLMPVFLFALLHVTKYTKTLLNLMGPTSMSMIRRLITKIDGHQREILKLIATVEISLMPTTVLLIITGNGTFLLPFGYYRFLCMRYTSIRNPYCRTVFTELRMLVEYMARHPKCPAIVGNFIPKIVAFVCRMSPIQPAPAPQQQ